MKPMRWMLAVLCAVALVAAACGDDESDTSAADDAAAAAQAEAAAAAEEAAAARVFSHEAQSSEQPGTPSECHRTPGFWGFLNGMTS